MLLEGMQIGFDLVEVPRVERLLQRWGKRVLRRLLCESERRYVTSKRSPALHLAGFIAAKEACFKALGAGPAQGVGWRDVVIEHTSAGAPVARVAGKAREAMRRCGASTIAVSISHERAVAGAVAVLVVPWGERV